ncbi:bacteriohemerythrin [Patescibacteria group bacterium]
MSLIEWQNSYSVGVQEIDEQHKKLFSILNQLFTAIDEKGDIDNIEEIMDGLIDYIQTHFSTEEKYFEEFSYDNKDAHIEEHKFYIDKVNTMIEQYENNKSFITYDILDFLENWIINHVTGTDKKYAKCFQNHGLK